MAESSTSGPSSGVEASSSSNLKQRRRPNAPGRLPSGVPLNPGTGAPRTAMRATSSSSVQRVPLLNQSLSMKIGDQPVNPQIELDPSTGKMKLSVVNTPWQEFGDVDLSDSFLKAIHEGPFEPKKKLPWWRKRRTVFIVGGILGILSGWLFAEGDPLSGLANLDFGDGMSKFDLQNLMSELPSLTSLNVTDMFTPGREWLNARSTNFLIGREAAERGLEKKHAVFSSGLESWSTTPDAAPWFRKRIWASTTMIRALITSKDTWVKAMSLDEHTGLDPIGYKVRAAQGLDAATAFMPGYWIWQKVIENLAVINYDHNDMHLMSCRFSPVDWLTSDRLIGTERSHIHTDDWRLSYYNLEVRDQYFSRLKSQIDYNLAIGGKKTALLSHSMGSLVVLWFMKWAEHPEYGKGGPTWVEEHISDWINIAGTMLGVPKAMSALLSGEMRDTVELNGAAVYLLEKYFSRQERAKLFRSWAGAASMMLKGGNAIWGDQDSAPDDHANATLTAGIIYYFKPETQEGNTDITQSTANPNLTIEEATSYILNHVPPSYQTMIHSNFSFGFESDPVQLKKNDDDHRKWTNPVEVALPNAPSLSIYCLYGTGKETERAYFYQQGGYEHDEAPTVEEPVCTDPDAECGDMEQTPRPPLDLPLSRRVWIDPSVTLDGESIPKVRSGVVFNDGDGTVSLLSLGAMCAKGWKLPHYNPGGSKVITHEIKHEPLAFDPRGGPTTADHVDILGSSELNDAIMEVVSGNGEKVKNQYFSEIRSFVEKIKW
ncbi:BQ5605_C002g01628 [Microbotryum silenes-dioicae]|uniref:BQ5605_C002g01628 protein n=1 Tax=Microbotryum silenes-dioicae TaxID=796604 RepID=A0A2X0P233_9BASI|nr:BQ5605_C002g01628 [Microbotryum silenes-dioicae]